jgi:NACalpha-BTF3-like transcription factor
MADKQPPTVVEGATTGDVDDEVPPTAAAKSAEDRKAAAALSSLDSAQDESSSRNNVDQDAVNKAMKNVGAQSQGGAAALPVRKNIKVDAADVALLVDQLDMPKPKATELLRSHDGDVTKTLKAYVTAA